MIIINNKQSKLFLKNWLRLHSGSGPSLKNQLRLHSYFRKSSRLRPSSTPTLRLLYTSGGPLTIFLSVGFYQWLL